MPGEDFDVDLAGPDTQIHAAALFDGEALWITYNRPEPGGTGNFDVWAVRLGCDGVPLHGPFRVNTTVEPNDVDSDLAVSRDRLSIVWQSDTGEFPDNLSIGYRFFELDGTPVHADDRRLVTTWDGAEVTGNHWQSSVVAARDGGFLVGGARAIPAATAFQVFAQGLGSDGAPTGDTLSPVLEPDVSQTAPSVAFGAEGPRMSWTRTDETSEQAWVAQLPEGTPAQLVAGAEASGMSHLHGGWAAVAITSAGEQDVELLLDGGGLSATLGAPGRIDHSPRLADGAIAFLRNESGLRNDLVVQTFTASDTDGVVVSPEHVVATDVPPYQPAITRVAEGLYAVVWSRGTSPDFRLVGRFVSL